MQQLLEATTDIRIATPADKSFIDSLQKKFSNQVGFMPGEALDWYLEEQGVQIALENDEPAGYILSRGYLRWNIAIRPITQAAVCMDAQRRHIGLAIVNRIEADAREAGQVALQAMCRQGLEANDFWRAAGFKEICHLQPNATRGKHIICWRKLITSHSPAWFATPPQRQGFRARSTVIA